LKQSPQALQNACAHSPKNSASSEDEVIVDRIAVVVLRVRIEHKQRHARAIKRAYGSVLRHVLGAYGAVRLPTGEHQLTLEYQTDQELDNLVDDLLFEISAEAQMWNCYSETEAHLEGSVSTEIPSGNS
jgi:hypothetical protein